jgi:hypothetical protein
MPSHDKKKEEGKKMEVIDLTLDLEDDKKSSTSKDIDFNIFAAAIVCPLVYTRGQTNAARVPGSVLFTVQCIPAASSNPSNVGNMQANLANMQDDLDHPLRPRQPEPLPPTLSQLWHVWVCDTSFLVDYGLSQSSTQTIMNQKWIDCCPRHPNQLETRGGKCRGRGAGPRPQRMVT